MFLVNYNMCYENHYKSYANVTIYFHTLIIPSSSLKENGMTDIILICRWLPFSWIIVGDSSINMFLQVNVMQSERQNWYVKNDYRKHWWKMILRNFISFHPIFCIQYLNELNISIFIWVIHFDIHFPSMRSKKLSLLRFFTIIYQYFDTFSCKQMDINDNWNEISVWTIMSLLCQEWNNGHTCYESQN